jgi:hypothetical protein
MRIRGIVWLREIVDKLAVKHHVQPVLFIHKKTREALILSACDMAGY